eukprot:scaffold286935_cov33-Tisochrysis_lutea.AAC.2
MPSTSTNTCTTGGDPTAAHPYLSSTITVTTAMAFASTTMSMYESEIAIASMELAFIESKRTRGKVQIPSATARIAPTSTSRATTRVKSDGTISPAPRRRTSSAIVWPDELPPPPTSMVRNAARTTCSAMRPSNASITQPEADCTSIRLSSQGKRAPTRCQIGMSKYMVWTTRGSAAWASELPV